MPWRTWRSVVSVTSPSIDPAEPGVLSELTLFQGVPARELERLAPSLHRRSFPAGSTVLTTEQPGEAVYILL